MLIVDDDEQVAKALARRCARQHDVGFLCDPRAALAALERGERYDVILTDLMMPGLSGMELYRAVGRLDKAQADRMVFMTGGVFTSEVEGFLATVPNRRLSKPIEPEALEAVLRTA